MTDREEWGDWIEHDGAGVPDDVIGAWAQVEMRTYQGDLAVNEGIMTLPLSLPEIMCWTGGGFFERLHYACPVIRYRIRKPRGLTILENLIADLPAPTTPKVDA